MYVNTAIINTYAIDIKFCGLAFLAFDELGFYGLAYGLCERDKI